MTPNGDYSKWTVELREGVLFHDGTPCDAAAVKGSIDAVRSGSITSAALQPIVNTVVLDSTTLRIDLSSPWIPFPAYLASQLGYICAPAMLKSANQGADRPIGTGPFRFVEWKPGIHLIVKKNKSYWQKAYPYLDGITFTPIADPGTRTEALESGTIDILHTQYPASVRNFLGKRPAYNVIEGNPPPGAEPDIDFIMLNCMQPPTSDIDVRRALAMATDKDQLQKTFGAGLTTVVDGPFQPGSAYYTPTAYPAYNPRAAKALIQSYEQRTGKQLAIQLGTISGPEYAGIESALAVQWAQLGIKVNPSQYDLSTFIFYAAEGGYQAFTFEQFSATDPDQNYIWWSTQTVAPVGKVSLNLARNSDRKIQAALEVGRSNPDQAARVEAYQTVAKQLAIDLPYLWISKTLWAAVTQPYIAGVESQTLPGGTAGIGFDNGSFLVHQIRRNA